MTDANTTKATDGGALVPAFPSKTAATLTIAGKQFDYAAQVTRTVLRQADDTPFYIEFQSRIAPSKMDAEHSKYKGKDGEGVVPEVADVMNLETGELQVLIVNTVLGSELKKAYPEDGYVGRLFGVRRARSDIDKRYKQYEIIEIKRRANAPREADPVKHIDGTTPEALANAKASGKHKAA